MTGGRPLLGRSSSAFSWFFVSCPLQSWRASFAFKCNTHLLSAYNTPPYPRCVAPRDLLEGGETPPPSGHPAYAQQVPASTAFVADSNRPLLLWQPPSAAYLTASGAACEALFRLMHPWHPCMTHRGCCTSRPRPLLSGGGGRSGDARRRMLCRSGPARCMFLDSAWPAMNSLSSGSLLGSRSQAGCRRSLRFGASQNDSFRDACCLDCRFCDSGGSISG